MIRILSISFLLIYQLYAAKLHFTTHQLKGNILGSTLLVIGGIHGNEPGGYFAAAILTLHYQIKKGQLIVVPNLNFDSIIRNRRGIYGDMNRKFANISKNDPDYHIIKDIKSIILRPDVDFILNLHDGHGFYRKEWQNAIFNPSAWGQACIIDQKCIETKKYGNLDAIAQKITKNLNQDLVKNHHSFNVKNTKTKFKDEQMRLSLTYFAITHGKPAMAIETSKNLEKTYEKVYYQLRAIEEFMKFMKIEFTRDFDLNLQTIQKILTTYYTAVLNDLTPLNLDHLRKRLNFVPMKKDDNHLQAKHPLAAIKKNGSFYDLMVGNIRISQFKPEIISHNKCLESVEIVVDKKLQNINIPASLSVKESFKVNAPKDIRVNVIGYTKPGLLNENSITIKMKELLPKYSLDKEQKSYRIEFYKDKDYCGMININIK
ncbi:M14 family metallopeptidase [Hydrogenimonas thermophila]|uniref:Metallo-carboxypeptidase-like protein n=1 Tax=Hydrogenimonas thermophila TaxID=223786 RepID=A0A1I5LUZ6_9BACT|nr:M14 family metallopeptidase [Hydrogenimonas thermophila]WOE70449.1 M99 family carboxypeptidase catalytic domain-containing protein [Hydrogenimonas thermophila]WOE72966.1 M99 family carboxypeptidase catalytic domain-containing protein [Hydrogenimonas thermophila]SFP01100.1 metallo-carboxypeptidase-like protein [Hydrogenimonas thermophila]